MIPLTSHSNTVLQLMTEKGGGDTFIWTCDCLIQSRTSNISQHFSLERKFLLVKKKILDLRKEPGGTVIRNITPPCQICCWGKISIQYHDSVDG